MKPAQLIVAISVMLIAACSGPETGPNGGTNNGGTNNGGTNNGGTNSGGTNNGGINNGGTNNGGTNNGGTNNGGTNNGFVPGEWERIDGNIGLEFPFATYRLAADDAHVYALTLVEDEDPAKSWNVLRSADEGQTWESVLVTSSGRAVRASYFGDVDGRLVLVVPAFDQAAMFYSADGGTTWKETTKVPATRQYSVGRSGDTWIVSGFSTNRSSDDGETWEVVGGTPPEGIGKIVRFGDSFWGISQVGERFRLTDGADAWAHVDGLPESATDLWVHGDVLWLKGTYTELATSPDGVEWTTVPTAEADQYGWVYPARTADALPWFLADEASDKLLLSFDEGATAHDVTGAFPRDANDFLCKSLYVTTADFAFAANRGAVFEASGCTPGEDEGAGLYRVSLN